jgi:hypothetical protein
MTAKALAQVLVRCWGLVLIISALAWVGNLVAMFGAREGREMFVAGALRAFVELGAGIAFVLNGDGIGAWLVSDIETTGEPGEPVDAVQIQIVAFVILGVYFLVTGLAHMASVSYTLLSKPQWNETGQFEYLLQQRKETLVLGVVDVVAGIILLLNRVGLANVILKTWRVIRARDDDAADA